MSDLTKGVVTDDDDPGGDYKVEVSLPSLRRKNVWCDVASFYASAGGGACFLPEKGDEVLVDFIDGDQNQPVVVGSLFSKKTPPPKALHGRARARGLQTSSGAMVRFDDQGRVEVTSASDVEVVAGRNVEVKAGKDVAVGAGHNAGIESGNDFGVESGGDVSVVAGRDVGVTAAKAALVQAATKLTMKGLQVDVEAAAQVTVEGAQATLAGAATTTVSGGIVRIN